MSFLIPNFPTTPFHLWPPLLLWRLVQGHQTSAFSYCLLISMVWWHTLMPCNPLCPCSPHFIPHQTNTSPLSQFLAYIKAIVSSLTFFLLSKLSVTTIWPPTNEIKPLPPKSPKVAFLGKSCLLASYSTTNNKLPSTLILKNLDQEPKLVKKQLVAYTSRPKHYH